MPVAAPPMALASPRNEVSEMIVTSAKRAQAAGLRPEDIQLPVQPPLERLTGKACVIYALG
jgi:hypothetical protein